LDKPKKKDSAFRSQRQIGKLVGKEDTRHPRRKYEKETWVSL